MFYNIFWFFTSKSAQKLISWEKIKQVKIIFLLCHFNKNNINKNWFYYKYDLKKNKKMQSIFKITILIIAVAINTEASLFKAGNDWNDLKVTWGRLIY